MRSLYYGAKMWMRSMLLRNTYVEWNGTPGRKLQRVASAAHTELREAARATHETQQRRARAAVTLCSVLQKTTLSATARSSHNNPEHQHFFLTQNQSIIAWKCRAQVVYQEQKFNWFSSSK
jgi:hypothetical protein